MNKHTSDPTASSSLPLLLKMMKMKPKWLSWKLGIISASCGLLLNLLTFFNLVGLGVKLLISNTLPSVEFLRHMQRSIKSPASLNPHTVGGTDKTGNLTNWIIPTIWDLITYLTCGVVGEEINVSFNLISFVCTALEENGSLYSNRHL